MPRKRRAARAFRAPQSSVHARIRQDFLPGCLALLFLTVENFYDKLRTEAERNAFCDEYPEVFYDLFNLESSVFDQYPASVVVATGSCVFRRWNFAAEYLQAHPPRTRFIPPDLRNLPYLERHPAMAGARAGWWKTNGWEMTDAEARWCLYGPPKPTAPPRTVALERVQ